MKNVFITGASGFIGKHLARRLLNNKYAVFGLHRQQHKNTSMQTLEQLGMHWIGANEVEDLFAKFKIDCVVHLATHYGRNGETEEVHESNLTMPLFILSKFLEQNGQLFLNTDSYYTKGGRSYPAMQAYSETKNLFRILGDDLTKNTDCKFITARLEHVYGPDDNEQKLIPFLIRQFTNNIEKIDLSSCEQSRDFVFVNDVCNAMHLILSNYSYLSPECVELEIGTGQAVPLKNLIEYLATTIGTHTKRNYGAVNQRNGEISSSSANLQWTSSIDWTPTIKMHEGLDLTIHSYLKNHHQ